MKVNHRSQRRLGFTLVELLVVMGIIAILAALLTPALMAAMDRAHMNSSRSFIHQCEVAAAQFFNDHGDYPPSTWAELDEFFKIPNPDPHHTVGDPLYDPLWDGGLFSNIPGTHGFIDDTTNPSTVNEGIEVFTACLATQNGGPYLQPGGDQLGNTDDDYDSVDRDAPEGTDDVRQVTNWYFGGNQVFELVDYWGNPLVYFHNRVYSAHDGYDPTTDTWEDPMSPSEAVLYEAAEGTKASFDYSDASGKLQHGVVTPTPCYARSAPDPTLWPAEALKTGTYPNLNSYQLYSWGLEAQPGCYARVSGGTVTPNPTKPGIAPGWTAASGKLANWEE